MVDVFVGDVFDTEIVDDERESDGTAIVFPESGSDSARGVAVGSKEFAEIIIGNAAGLGKTIHAAANLNAHVSVVDFVMKLVVIHDLVWNVFDRDAHVFVSGHWGAQVEVLEITGHEFSIGRGQDTVDKALDSSEPGCFGAGVVGVVDSIATTGPTNAAGVILFRAESGDNSEVGWFAALWNLMAVNEEDGVGSFDVLVSLGETRNFFGVGGLPKVAFATLAEFLVFRNASRIRIEGIAVQGVVYIEVETGVEGQGSFGRGG